VTVGIYFQVPMVEDVEELTHTAQTFAQVGLNLHGGNHMGVVNYVQRRMDDGFTGRPFYVETREEGRGVQVYQPYGMPQDAT
jgi:hypothetical protein